MKSDLIEISGIIKHETEKAILLDHGGKEPCWLPKSQVEIEPDTNRKTVTVTLRQSLAEDKGIV